MEACLHGVVLDIHLEDMPEWHCRSILAVLHSRKVWQTTTLTVLSHAYATALTDPYLETYRNLDSAKDI